MMESPYRVGIVGCGSISDQSQDELIDVPGWIPFPYSHAQTLEAHERTHLVAAMDPDTGRLGTFADRWSLATGFESIGEMIVAQALDILVISSPTKFHSDHFIEAAEAGIKGVFLEKPVARTLTDVDAMIAAAHAHGTSVVVNHFRSFDPSYRRVRDMITQGAIGSVTGVVAVWGEGVSQGGCHLFDLLRMILGSPTAWVFASLDNDRTLPDPGGTFLLGLENNVVVTVHMPWSLNAPAQLDILGTEGKITITHYERTLTRFEVINGRAVPVESPLPMRNATRSGMLVALDELIRQMETGAPTSSGLEEGRRALETTGAVLISGRECRRVSLPLADTGLVIDSWL